MGIISRGLNYLTEPVAIVIAAICALFGGIAAAFIQRDTSAIRKDMLTKKDAQLMMDGYFLKFADVVKDHYLRKDHADSMYVRKPSNGHSKGPETW